MSEERKPDDAATTAPAEDKVRRSQAGAKPEPTRPAQPTPPPTGKALLRMLDEGIEEEMSAALAAFDGEKTLSSTQKAGALARVLPARGQPPEKRAYRVVAVRGEDVYVDMGERSEGVVPALQFENLPAAGDLIELVVDRYDRANDLYTLRRPGAAQEADWGSVAKGMVVDALVKKVNKGGLEVSVNGLRGFLPAGQADIEHIADLGTLMGQVLRCEVTEANLSSRNLVVSRRIILEREREEKARATLANLAEGQVLEGVVRRVTDFGAFVDIGGVDGLIHVSQLSWQRVAHPSDVVSPGQKVKVVVLKFEPQGKKISLGLRQLEPSPWDRAAEKYPVGAIVPGTVTRATDFGAFVELEPGIEGLIHISELSAQRVQRVANVVNTGQSVEVKILSFDRAAQRISLSLKQATAQAEDTTTEASTDATAPEPVAKPRKNSVPLKGGLGGGSGPLFG